MMHRFAALGLVVFSSVCLAQLHKKIVVDDKQAEREEWFYTQRAYPNTRIPAGARLKALSDIERMDGEFRALHPQAVAAETDSTMAAGLVVGKWTSIGPRPTDAGSLEVTSGRINSIAIDPRNSKTIYIGAAEGGVWKTKNGGATWSPLTDAQPSLANGAIALDPSNPDVVYVGSGEENFAIDSYYGAGILKSTNAGSSWKNIVGPFLRAYIGGLSVHSTRGQLPLCPWRVRIF